MTEPIDRIGQRFGDYVLQHRLGRGSFGDVYLGAHVRDDSPAAVKILHTGLTRSEDLRAFINEVRTFRLQHPHVVRLLDVGIAPDEAPFLVMEYLAGGTLRERYPTGSKVPFNVVVDLTRQLASALQYAHDQNLVHRDVKPENMLCRADGTVLLSDFGIASVAPASSSVSLYQGVGGTLPYMAPEQLQGKPRQASDQYALAVVVYEWLVGARPFQGTAPELISQHLHTPPPSLLDRVPTLPAAVEQVVFKALSKQPQERFARIDDFAAALQAASQTSVAPAPTMPLHPPVPPLQAAPGRNPFVSERLPQPAQEPGVMPPQERITLPPISASHAPLFPQGPAAHAPMGTPQTVLPPQRSAMVSSPPASVQPKRRLSRTAIVVGILIFFWILLALMLLGGGRFNAFNGLFSLVDLLFLLTAGLLIFDGSRNGFIFSLINLFSLPIASVVAWLFARPLIGVMAASNLIGTPMGSYVFLFFAVVLVVHLLTKILRRRRKSVVVRGDTALGSIVGFVEGWVLWVVVLLLVQYFLHHINQIPPLGINTLFSLYQYQIWQQFYNATVAHSLFAKANSFLIQLAPLTLRINS